MKTSLSLRFTVAGREAVPEGIALNVSTDSLGVIPVPGDDIVLAGIREKVLFRVVRRQIEYVPGDTLITLLLDASPNEYLEP